MTSDMAIELTRVSKSVTQGDSERSILREVSLTVPAGRFVSLVGPSGSGKSTLLSVIAGLTRPTSGSVRFLGQSLETLSEDALAAFRSTRIGFVFQDFHLIPTLTIQENIQIPLELTGRFHEAPDRALLLLERIGLGHRAPAYPNELSGGEQQRVALARALALKPPVLLADEPTGNLDRQTSLSVMSLLKDLCREMSTTVILVTHNPEIAAMADRIITLVDGEVQTPEDAS